MRPKEVVYVGGAKDGVARTIFLDNFSESDIHLSLAAEQPIWKKLPESVAEIFSWPHPANEVQNRMNAAINAFIHFPIALLLLNYANWPWYTLVPAISVSLRFSTAYRFDPQAWIVLYLSKFMDPHWVPGAPNGMLGFSQNSPNSQKSNTLVSLDLLRSFRRAYWSLLLAWQLAIIRHWHRGSLAYT